MKLWLPLLIAVIGIVGLGALELRRQHAMTNALPEPTPAYAHEIQAMLLARRDLVAVKGTGSMRPYIKGGDDNAIVAYVEVERVPFMLLRKGDLVVYRRPDTNILHQLADRDGSAWVASGLANPFYDRTRVTADNYVGRVIHTYPLK